MPIKTLSDNRKNNNQQYLPANDEYSENRVVKSEMGRENGILTDNRYIESSMPKSFKDAPNYLKSNTSSSKRDTYKLQELYNNSLRYNKIVDD